MVNPPELVKCFAKSFELNQFSFTGNCICIDEKIMRATDGKNTDAIHMISAWSNEHGIILTALESKGNKNEIKTIPDFIEVLSAKDTIISTDAMDIFSTCMKI